MADVKQKELYDLRLELDQYKKITFDITSFVSINILLTSSFHANLGPLLQGRRQQKHRTRYFATTSAIYKTILNLLLEISKAV